MDVYVNPRIERQHPDISASMVREAWDATLRCIPRDTAPVQWVGVGVADGKLIEYVAIENDDGAWHIFHAMKTSRKTLREVGLQR